MEQEKVIGSVMGSKLRRDRMEIKGETENKVNWHRNRERSSEGT